ncbi:MAG: apolipoprotein N-acyltransferase [Candidatus Methylomirabilis oxyfera]|nr:apolipoprotein N-acyltransferase [Candidatus Methylomirabilis oxyfera]
MTGAPLFAARCGGALLTACFYVLAFPAADQGWLAWVALVPLLLACEGLKPGAAFALGLLSGVGTAFGIYRWLFEVPGFGMQHATFLALYVGLYTGAWCGGLPLLKRARLPLLITGPALWVVLDYLKAHAGFLALPWATLAHSQHKDLAILQVASLTGEYGVTFLVVMGSVAVTEVVMRRAWRSALVVGLLIGLAHAAGAGVLTHSGGRPGIQVAVVQPNIRAGEQRTPSDRAAITERLERLTLAAAASRPALIAWPETAVGDFSKDRSLAERLQALALAARTPMIVGASESFKFAPRESEVALRVHSYNSAYFVAPGEPIDEPYRKMRLVPFAEYLPLEGVVPWPSWLAPRVRAMTPGEVRRQFMLPDGARVGVLICWENLFADFVRPAVQDGAQLFVQLTNDAWFGRTGAPRQHNLASVLRAVENRTPVVIASNTGPSQIIDPYGRVVAGVPALFNEGVATGAVPLGSGGTPYTRFGDLLVFAALAWLVLRVIVSAVHRLSVRDAGSCGDAHAWPINEPTHR